MQAFRILLLVLLPAALAGCNPFAEYWEWNQKLTIEVMTPEGLRSGSAVSSVWWREPDPFGNYQAKYSGEATVVDLGEGRYLFALIGEDTKQVAAYTLHAELGEQRGDYEKLFPKIVAFRGVREVPRERFPLLVTFGDINDPTTVRKVDPEDLAASFSPGVSLQQVLLEITDEKETGHGIERLLKWLDWSREQFLAAGGGETPLKVSGETIGRANFAKR